MFKGQNALLRMLETEQIQSIWTLIFIDCMKKSKTDQEKKECMKKLDDKIRNKDISNACKILEDTMVHDTKNIKSYVSRMQKLAEKGKSNITLIAKSLYRYFDLAEQINNKETLNRKIKELRLSPELSKKIKKMGIFTSKRGTSLLISKNLYTELSEKFLKDPFKNTHLLWYYSRDSKLLQVMPFRNKQVFFVLHFLKDLIPFVKASVNLGLDMKNAHFFYKDYPYPQRESMKKWLEEQGATVKPRSYIPQCLKQLTESSSIEIKKILIVEDGGFFVPLIHREFTQLIQHVIGAVEQTTRGIRNAENWKKEKKKNRLRFPIISVATSELKNKFEPPYIADAIVDNIKRLLPHIALRGKKAALFGCGTIGMRLLERLRQNGMNVTIFEPDYNSQLGPDQEAFSLSDSPTQTAHDKTFVIGTSGNKSINSQVIASLSHETYLVSTSSELYEIDVDELARQSKESKILSNNKGENIGTTFILPRNRHIHLLCNGYPINFWGFESMPEEASDLVLSLILLSAAEVAAGNYSTPEINPDAVNQIAKKYEVAKKFLEFHKQG